MGHWAGGDWLTFVPGPWSRHFAWLLVLSVPKIGRELIECRNWRSKGAEISEKKCCKIESSPNKNRACGNRVDIGDSNRMFYHIHVHILNDIALNQHRHSLTKIIHPLTNPIHPLSCTGNAQNLHAAIQLLHLQTIHHNSPTWSVLLRHLNCLCCWLLSIQRHYLVYIST